MALNVTWWRASCCRPKEKLYGYKKPEAAAKPKMKNVLPSNLEAAKKELKSKVCMKGWRWVGYARGVP